MEVQIELSDQFHKFKTLLDWPMKGPVIMDHLIRAEKNDSVLKKRFWTLFGPDLGFGQASDALDGEIELAERFHKFKTVLKWPKKDLVRMDHLFGAVKNIWVWRIALDAIEASLARWGSSGQGFEKIWTFGEVLQI